MADITNTVKVLFLGEDNGATSAASRVADSFEKVDAATKRSTTSSNLWQDAQGRWRNEAGRFASDTEKAANGIETFGKKSADAARETSLLTDVVKQIGAIVIAKAFIDANVEVERFTKSVTAIKGSGEAAGQELDYLRAVSDRLGLAVRETAGSYSNFLAATKGTALEGEASRKIFESISGAMSNLGKSSADTSGVLNALQQSISKGQIYAEELRGQIGERLPGAFQLFAKSMGVSTSELNVLLEAGKVGIDTLPAFAAEVEKAFGNTGNVEGFTASLNRLKNQLDDTFVAIGKIGTFDAITSGLQIVGKLVEAGGSTFDYFGTAAKSAFNVIRGGSLDTFNAEMQLAEQRVAAVSARLDGDLNQTLAETARLQREAAAASEGFSDQSKAETDRLIRQANAQTQALKETADAFKTLGVNPNNVKKGVEEILSAFDTLSKSQNVTGSQLLSGLEAALKNIDDKKYLPRLRGQLLEAKAEGRITGDELSKALGLVDKAQESLDKKLGVTTKSIADQAKETQKAAEKTAQFKLELEKLASNERIKILEFKAALDITNVQEQTKRIQAAFESLDNTVNSTADVINQAFGLLAGGGDLVDSSVRNKLFSQLDIENANRDRALNLQAELTAAQIKVLTAQAEQLTRGDALIKIDGAGLAPHLEAFMWEILKAVQVRANRDGMKLLLGL